MAMLRIARTVDGVGYSRVDPGGQPGRRVRAEIGANRRSIAVAAVSSTSLDVRQVQPHRFQVDDVVQDYSQAIPASHSYAALIREPGDTFARAYWNTSQESQSHGYDRQWDAGSRYP